MTRERAEAMALGLFEIEELPASDKHDHEYGIRFAGDGLWTFSTRDEAELFAQRHVWSIADAILRACAEDAAALRRAGDQMSKVFGEEHRGFCAKSAEDCDAQAALEAWAAAIRGRA